MPKTLIIAEKPSVATDIARSLGGFEKKGDYFESDGYVLTSAVGHLVEIKPPEGVEVKRGKWSLANLPVIPQEFALSPISKTEDRLKLITRLIKRKDVDTLVNACDAGREGELIFRLIAQWAKTKKPVKRLWLQSMTPSAIRAGFENLRDGEDLQPLASAARSRAEADWLIGINGTRAMTAFNSKEGGFFLTTVGRVQTPTLSIVVDRERQIKSFVPKDYWEVHAEFGCAAGTYEGRWFNPSFKKSKDDTDLRAERIWNEADAEKIVADCTGKPGTVTEESRPSLSNAPALFDLTSLQREANARFGFSAKNTLAIAQALYERHKVLTYPRTDSRHLPEDYLGTTAETMGVLAAMPAYAPFAGEILSKKMIKPTKRVFDNSMISDHFAIIPTAQPPKTLSEAERRIYDLVCRRFMAIFFPPAKYQVTTRTTEVAGHKFRSEGRVMTDPGWTVVYGKESQSDGKETEKNKILVPVKPGERVNTDSVESRALQTRPPARFTEATLLSAMEGAGKMLEEDLREAMDGKGLGTPATRATIIEGLITERYLMREGRDLIPTAKAFQLMKLLHGLNVDELTLPELTGEWEHKLSLMEKGEISREEFMNEISEMTETIVRRAREYNEETIPGDYAVMKAPCPSCGGVIRENYRRYACDDCDFSMTKMPSGRLFEYDEVEELLEKRQIGPLTGFFSKQGRPFAAVLKIAPDEESGQLKLMFDFGQQESEKVDKEELKGKASVGTCPVCGGQVLEAPMAYVCENSVGAGKKCSFRTSRVILQQEITPEQMGKLLTAGRTDLLPGFVSQRTKRPFKAYLVVGPSGKTSFEFEQREPKKTAAKSSAKATAAKTRKPAAKKTASAKTSASSAKKSTVSATGKKTVSRKKSEAPEGKRITGLDLPDQD